MKKTLAIALSIFLFIVPSVQAEVYPLEYTVIEHNHVIMLPQPKEEIIITGSKSFTETINKVLRFMQEKTPNEYAIVKNNVVSITEDNSLDKENLAKINVNNGDCKINYKSLNNFTRRYGNSEDLTKYTASLILHEAYHMELIRKGITIKELSVLEMEILANAIQRKFLKEVDINKSFLRFESVDEIIDTNYYGALN